jgi:hypothetical protein
VMRNVWFVIEGIAGDGPYTNVMTYDERQANTDTREGRRLNGWLASQPIGTVAQLGEGWTMTRVAPPKRNAPVKMPKGWILMSSGPGYSTWETTDRVHKIKAKKASNSWWGAHWSWNPNTRKHERVNTSPRQWTYAEIIEWAQQEARGITSGARRNDAKSARVLARHRHGAGYAPATVRRAGQGLARLRWGSRQMGLALGNPPDFETGDRVMVPKFGSEGRRIVRVGMQPATVLGPYLAGPPGWPPHFIVEIEDGSTLTVQARHIERPARQNPPRYVDGLDPVFDPPDPPGSAPGEVYELQYYGVQGSPALEIVTYSDGETRPRYGWILNMRTPSEQGGFDFQEINSGGPYKSRRAALAAAMGATKRGRSNPPIKRARRNPGRSLRGGAARIKR